MLRIFAPAKINLHLHVTGKRSDGYHLLDSLVVFSDVGDELVFEPAPEFQLDVKGEFASVLGDSNTIERAAKILAGKLGHKPDVRITLQKNLPAGAGIGGGSADAAACLKGLLQFWSVEIADGVLNSIALEIGSDVPVCLTGKTAIMRGTGNEITAAPAFPMLPAVMIWPNVHASTAEVYKNLRPENYSEEFEFQSSYEDIGSLVFDLEETRNDLEKAATGLFPAIKEALIEMKQATGCRFTRMSGSGSTVFGIFENKNKAEEAAISLRRAHPDWWVKTALLA